MTDPATPAVPAGWYDDATTPAQLRWWDGAAWTEHVAPAPTQVPPVGMVAERPPLPADRPVYSVFIWLMAFLPLVSLVLIFTWYPTIRFTGGGSLAPGVDYSSIYTTGYFLIVAVGFVVYGLAALLAYRDSVWLRRQGVVRPFPWPWVFLSAPLYVIGRSVIVRRVARPRGFAPARVAIAVAVVTFGGSMVWSVLFSVSLMQQMQQFSSSGF